MKSTILLFAIAILLATCTQKTTGDDSVQLLDKDLSKWEMYLGFRHQPSYAGSLPLDEKGDTIQPVGYNKNVNNVFTVIEENNEPVLKVSGEYYGCVFTKESFRNYRLSLKVKWGEKKWPPRTDKLKDAGVLYHSQGECGVDYWRAWMLGQELQLMEGHFGDYWNIANSAIDIRAFLPEGTMNPVASDKQPFIPLGTGEKSPGYCMRTADYESPKGEWSDVELVCYEGKSLHIINGHVVMVLANSRFIDSTGQKPLIEGKIQLQSEACEVYYKDVRIKKIDKMPEEYISLFK